MDGSTNVGVRARLVDDFNSDDGVFCFLLTTKVGGLGINLTGADRCLISFYSHKVDASTGIPCCLFCLLKVLLSLALDYPPRQGEVHRETTRLQHAAAHDAPSTLLCDASRPLPQSLIVHRD